VAWKRLPPAGVMRQKTPRWQAAAASGSVKRWTATPWSSIGPLRMPAPGACSKIDYSLRTKHQPYRRPASTGFFTPQLSLALHVL
jgi:hypothetical protein